MEPYALKISEAAKRYGINRFTIYDLINAGELPVVKRENADMLVLAKDVEEYLLRHRIVVAP